MVNVTVNRRKPLNVSTNNKTGAIANVIPVTLKSYHIDGVNRLDNLLDVDATSETDKSTLVYDRQTDKYVVKPLEFSEISGDLDGGTF